MGRLSKLNPKDYPNFHVSLRQHIKDFNMTMNYITDTDFISQNLDGDEYSLIYGILQHSVHQGELRDRYLYNLTTLLCLKQDTKVLKIVKAKKWMKLLEGIIEKLSVYDNNVFVTIPFCNIYGFNIFEIISFYELSYNTLAEFLSSSFDNIEVIEYITKSYPIQPLKDLFLNLAIEVESGVYDNESMTIDVCVVYDEMIRRGIDVGEEITKSELFNDDLYRQTFINGTKPKHIIVEVEDDNSPEELVTLRSKISEIKKIGTIYYMLAEALKDNKELIIKVANYVIDKEYDEGNKAGNSAYKYIHDTDLLTNKHSKVEYIKEQLTRYNIEMPKELK